MPDLLLQPIRIVLINTSHPGNIGAAARAMKTMGLTRLYLVDPQDFPSLEATARASGADDILQNAVICHSLPEALQDCTLVAGTTARERAIAAPFAEPREVAGQLLTEAQQGGEAALVFGRECSGLSNAEIDCCQLLAHIPTDADYSSLNLGAAVQVLSYELRLAALTAQAAEEGDMDTPDSTSPHPLDRRANFQELDSFYTHLEAVLTRLEFLDLSNPRLIMRRLRCLYDRAAPSVRELNILRGSLSATQKHLPAKTAKSTKEQ